MSTLNIHIFDTSIRTVSWLRATDLSLSQKYSCLCSCMKTDLQSQRMNVLIWFFFEMSLCILSRQIKENQISQKTTGTAYTKKVNPRLVPQPDSHSLHELWAHYAESSYLNLISNTPTCFNSYSGLHSSWEPKFVTLRTKIRFGLIIWPSAPPILPFCCSAKTVWLSSTFTADSDQPIHK